MQRTVIVIFDTWQPLQGWWMDPVEVLIETKTGLLLEQLPPVLPYSRSSSNWYL